MTHTQAQTTHHVPAVITPEALLEHLQGHRRLTRRVIESFPEDQLFSFSIGGMRTFAELLAEMLAITAPGVKGIATGQWESLDEEVPATTKAGLLRHWDEATETINAYWPQIPAEHFQEVVKAFGQYENTVTDSILYFIDNEIHHRAQGYVYLRSLGITPPPFWER